MGWIRRVSLFIELAPVVAVDKQAQGTFEGMRATREASGRSCQARQVVSQFSIVSFHR